MLLEEVLLPLNFEKRISTTKPCQGFQILQFPPFIACAPICEEQEREGPQKDSEDVWLILSAPGGLEDI